MDSMLPSGVGNYVPPGRWGLPVRSCLWPPAPAPVFGLPGHHILWNKEGGLAGVITKDPAISLSLLSLKYRELGFAFPEAAWTPEARAMASALLLVLSSRGVAQQL